MKEASKITYISSSEESTKNLNLNVKNNYLDTSRDLSSLEFNQNKVDKNFFNFKKIIVRFVHISLVLFITGNLFVQNTRLREALILREYPYLFCFIGLTYSSLLFFFLTCLLNPGYVEKSDPEATKNNKKSSLPNIRLRYCTYCELEQPIRSRHCEECKRCVKKFDHHCPWLETCVGEKNHKYFWLFLGTTNMLILWCMIITWSSFLHFPKWSDWLLRNLLFLFNMQVLVISYFISLSLFIIHTYFMFTNTTTWEKFSRNNITYLRIIKDDSNNPFHQSYFKNIYWFMCSPRENRWENVYATFFKNKVSKASADTSNTSSENEVQIKIEKNNQ